MALLEQRPVVPEPAAPAGLPRHRRSGRATRRADEVQTAARAARAVAVASDRSRVSRLFRRAALQHFAGFRGGEGVTRICASATQCAVVAPRLSEDFTAPPPFR